MKKSALNLQDETSFAYDKAPSKNGRILVICGREYEAWGYDTYIYEALNIAGYWDLENRTYERIMHLRNWLRENVQHAHDFPITVRSLSGAKKLVDKIIRAEFKNVDEYEEEQKFQLENNAKIFSVNG